MRCVREILRLRIVQGLGSREISKSVKCGKSSVNRCLKKAELAGLCTWEKIEALSDEQLELALYPMAQGRAVKKRGHCREPEWSKIDDELRNPKVTLQLLW